MCRTWSCCSCLQPPAQKAQWLNPLLAGDIGSAFAMTEPDVASSDPVNLQTRIEKDGEFYVVNGRKWFASNAGHAACELIIALGVVRSERAQVAAAITGFDPAPRAWGRHRPEPAGVRPYLDHQYPYRANLHQCSDSSRSCVG